MAALSNIEKHAARRREETRQKQIAYARAHAIAKRENKEPGGRDVANALLEIYVDGAIRHGADHHAVVRRLLHRGFSEDASRAFVERMVERSRTPSP